MYPVGCHYRTREVARRFKRCSWSCVYVLILLVSVGALQQVKADPGDRIRLGQAGEWRNTVAGVVVENRLYTIEKSGILYATDLQSGKWRQIGKPEFGNTMFMFAVGQSLHTIETDGSLYRVNRADGTWARVGAAGAWKQTIVGATLNGRIYTIESSGILYETNPVNGVWRQIGKPEFSGTRHMFADGGSLFTIEDDGLYRVNPANGSWARVGKAEDWRGTIAGAIMYGKLYSVNANGALYESLLTNGQWRAVGQPVFKSAVHMFAGAVKLYIIEADGSLYAVEV
jgi:hypothetical protein